MKVCPDKCPDALGPRDLICGSDQVTYESMCHLQVGIKHGGECVFMIWI